MGKEITKLINRALSWDGYLEKKSNRDLDDFTANAGNKNYTCFARDYKLHTGQNLQEQPWCAMFVSEIFVQAFGLGGRQGGSWAVICITIARPGCLSLKRRPVESDTGAWSRDIFYQRPAVAPYRNCNGGDVHTGQDH